MIAPKLRTASATIVVALLVVILTGCIAPALTDAPTIDAIGAESNILLTDFSSDSKHLALLTQGNEVQLWDVADGSRIATVAIPDPSPRQLVLCANQTFATVTESQVVVWNATGMQMLVIPDDGNGIEFVRGDVGAGQLAVGHSDGSVSIWSIRRRQKLSALEPPIGAEVSFIGSNDHGVVYQTASNAIVLRSLQPGATDRVAEVTGDPSIDMAFSKDGNTMASVTHDATVEVRDLRTGQVSATISDLDADPLTLALSPDGSVLAVNGASGVELWDVATRELLEQFDTTLSLKHGVSFAPDGLFLSWVEANQTDVRFWSPVSGAVRWRSGKPELVANAQGICTDLAKTIRFRQTMEPHARGMEHLEANRLAEAKDAFAVAHGILPTYPGLEAARTETERRYTIMLRQQELLTLAAEHEKNADFDSACEALGQFSKEFPDYHDTSIRERATALRTMLAHVAVAEEHRRAGRDLDAILEFEKAVVVVPEIQGKHPEYVRLRTSLESRLEREADGSHESGDNARVIAVYGQLIRLRPLADRDWFRAGSAFEDLGRFDRAHEAFGKVSREAPEYADARWGLSRLARLRGDGAAARTELELAREVAPRRRDLESEYAEVCTLVNDIDSAVESWKRVGSWHSTDPAPFEEIAALEEQRQGWQAAGEAYEEAFQRAIPRQRELLQKSAAAYERAGRNELALEIYLETLSGVIDGGDYSWLSETPRITILNWIRNIGFVRHDGEWIARDEFLSQQGWTQHAGAWLRPEEAQLHAVAQRFQATPSTDHRTMTDQEYRRDTKARIIAKGMNRREVIRSWGFFKDMNRTVNASGGTFEQLLYEDGRQVYLSDGVVCSWTE